MRSLTRWGVGGLAAALLLAASLSPTQAAESLITAAKAADLMLPVAQIPADMQFRPDQSGPIGAKALEPLIGVSMLHTFQQNGWLLGYHGWLTPRRRSAPVRHLRYLHVCQHQGCPTHPPDLSGARSPASSTRRR